MAAVQFPSAGPEELDLADPEEELDLAGLEELEELDLADPEELEEFDLDQDVIEEVPLVIPPNGLPIFLPGVELGQVAVGQVTEEQIEGLAAEFERLWLEHSAKGKVTWGRRPRLRFRGRRLPRPPNPPGAARLWPFVRYPRRPLELFPEPIYYIPPPLSGDSAYDAIVKAIFFMVNEICKVRRVIYDRQAHIPKPMKAQGHAAYTAKLWAKHDFLLGIAENVCLELEACGVGVPYVAAAQFYIRF